MKINIAIDLDGTLLNSFDRHILLLKNILKKYNVPIKVDDYLLKKREGLSTRNYLIRKGLKLELVENICNEWKKDIENLDLLNLDYLYDDSIKFIENNLLKYNFILITARSINDNVLIQLDKLGIKEYFKKIIIVRNTGNVVKNKIDALKNFLCEAIIGDSEVEKEVADSLGIYFFILNRGLRSKKFLKKLGIFSYRDLLEIDLSVLV